MLINYRKVCGCVDYNALLALRSQITNAYMIGMHMTIGEVKYCQLCFNLFIIYQCQDWRKWSGE